MIIIQFKTACTAVEHTYTCMHNNDVQKDPKNLKFCKKNIKKSH